LYSYLRASDRAQYPEHPLAIEGRKFARSERKVAVIHAAGMFGWAAGPSKIIIEAHGIADPLLARLPASVFAGVGHYMRYRPEGYVDGLAQGRVQLEDADLNAYYQKLALITHGPRLFALERLKTIALFNLGAYDRLLEHFVREKIRGKQVLPRAH
jgi:arabinofuranosyltransferase